MGFSGCANSVITFASKFPAVKLLPSLAVGSYTASAELARPPDEEAEADDDTSPKSIC